CRSPADSSAPALCARQSSVVTPALFGLPSPNLIQPTLWLHWLLAGGLHVIGPGYIPVLKFLMLPIAFRNFSRVKSAPARFSASTTTMPLPLPIRLKTLSASFGK